MAARFYVAVFMLLFCLARANVYSSNYGKGIRREGKGIRREGINCPAPGIACAATIIAQAARPVQGWQLKKSRIRYDKIKIAHHKNRLICLLYVLLLFLIMVRLP